MRVVTPKQMKDIDNAAITQIGIPGIVLMENAALKVVEEIVKDLKHIEGKNILLFAGKGNNGGDAFAVARHLCNRGAYAEVYVLDEKTKISKDAYTNLEIIENMGIPVSEVLEKEHVEGIKCKIENTDLIVDGILGTGLKGELKGLVKDVIGIINHSGKPILAIDIPSGVCGITGRVLGTCIKAYKTVTFAFPKIGLVTNSGSEYTGELVVADIGIPQKVVDSVDVSTFLTNANYVSRLIPGRITNSNKGDYGRVLIISGSIGMTGAGVLSAGAALRTGAGLVYLGVPSLLTSVYDAALVETVTIPLEDEGKGTLSKNCIGQIRERLAKMSVVAIGPGLSTNEDIYDIVSSIIDESLAPLIIDADALNVISKDISVLKKN